MTIKMYQSAPTGVLQMDSYTTVDPVRQAEDNTEADTCRSSS